jgi:lysozyme family protein
VFLVYPRVAEELFDTGVNMGPKVAATFLQRALNALNRGASDYPDITADGMIGAMTVHALNGYRAKRGEAGEAVLLKALDALQGARYIGIAEANPKQEAFLYGWLANRVGALA